MSPDEIRALSLWRAEPVTSRVKGNEPAREPFLDFHGQWILDEVGYDPTEQEPLGEEPEDQSPLGNQPVLQDLLERLAKISKVEADILELRLLGCREQDIAQILGPGGHSWEQAAVSYRLHRGLDRIRWMVGPGSWFSPGELRESLQGFPAQFNRQMVEILTVVWETTSQTITAKRLGIRGSVSCRIIQAIDRMGQIPELKLYYEGFMALKEGRTRPNRRGAAETRRRSLWNILVEIDLPQWSVENRVKRATEPLSELASSGPEDELGEALRWLDGW